MARRESSAMRPRLSAWLGRHRHSEAALNSGAFPPELVSTQREPCALRGIERLQMYSHTTTSQWNILLLHHHLLPLLLSAARSARSLRTRHGSAQNHHTAAKADNAAGNADGRRREVGREKRTTGWRRRRGVFGRGCKSACCSEGLGMVRTSLALRK